MTCSLSLAASGSVTTCTSWPAPGCRYALKILRYCSMHSGVVSPDLEVAISCSTMPLGHTRFLSG